MIIFRYLAKEVFAAAGAVLLVLLLVFLSTQLAIYLSKMANGTLDPQILWPLLAVIAISLIGILLPMTFFIALLLTYGRLYAESEMTALFACGLSRRRLAIYTLLMGLPILLLSGYLSCFAGPQLMAYQNTLLLKAVDENILRTITPGRFQQTHDGEKIFYVENISRDRKKLDNIFMAERNPQTKQFDILLAKSGFKTTHYADKGNFIEFEQGTRYVGEAGKKNFLLFEYDQYGIRLPEVSLSAPDPSHLSSLPTASLWTSYPNHPKVAAELQWRISIPLQTFLLALVAIPLSRTAPRQGRYFPLFPAMLVYLFYANSLFVGKDWLEKGQLAIHPGLAWIHLILLGLTLYLYLGKPGWDPITKFSYLWRRSE